MREGRLRGWVALVLMLGAGMAMAQSKPLIEQWVDGEIKAALPPLAYHGAPIALKFNSFLPPTASLAQLQVRTFKRLEADTGGKIAVRPYWGSTLGNAQRGSFDVVESGIADTGTCFAIMNPGGFDLTFGLNLPHIFDSSVQSTAVATELYPKYFKKEYESRGVRLLRTTATPPVQILSIKAPIARLEDLKGRKLWATGGLSAQLAAALGATPAATQVSELYTAFQSGVVDAVAIHDAAAHMLRLTELARYRAHADLWVYSAEYCINRDVWAKLPPDLRRIVYHWAQLASHAEAQLYFDRDALLARAAMATRGVKTSAIDQPERARWNGALDAAVTQFMNTGKARGLPVAQLVNDMRALQRKYAAMSPDDVTRMLLEKPLPGLADP